MAYHRLPTEILFEICNNLLTHPAAFNAFMRIDRRTHCILLPEFKAIYDPPYPGPPLPHFLHFPKRDPRGSPPRRIRGAVARIVPQNRGRHGGVNDHARRALGIILTKACEAGWVRVAAAALAAGAPVFNDIEYSRWHEDGVRLWMEPLVGAARAGSLPIVRLLLALPETDVDSV